MTPPEQLTEVESRARHRDVSIKRGLIRAHQRKTLSQFDGLLVAVRRRVERLNVTGASPAQFTVGPSPEFVVSRGPASLEVRLNPGSSSVDYVLQAPHPELGTRRAVQGVTGLPRDSAEAEQLSGELLQELLRSA